MSGMTDMAKVELIINSEPAIKELNNLQNNLAKAKEKLETLRKQGAPTKDIVRAQKEVTKFTQKLSQAESRSKAVERALTDMNKRTPRELNASIRTLMGHLQGLEKGTAAWNIHAEAIRKLKGRLAELKEELSAQEPWWNRAVSWVNKWQTAIVGVVAGSGSVIDFFRESVDAYAEMDQEMANVRKFAGMTDEEVANLNDEFKKIDTRTGREQLNKLAQEAGRLGKSSIEDVLGYVRAADQINVALDDLGEGATLTLSKLTGVFGIEKIYGTEQALLKVGSVVNELSQNCKASAPYLTNFSERMGGVGAQANMLISQILGIGAVLDDNAQPVEASATAISQVLVRMMADPAKYASVAGLDIQNFTRLLKEDANEALLEFLEALNNAGGMDVLSPMFMDMGEKGSRAIAALSTLAIHIDDVRAQQEAARIAFEEGTSVTKEFEVQNNTVQASLEKAKNRVQELRVELGKQLLPVMRHVVSTSSLLLKGMLTTINFVSQHKAVILSLIAAITAYTVAVKANAIALKMQLAAQTLGNKAMSMARVVTLATSVVYNTLTGNITRATAAQKLLNIAFKASPVGLLIAGLTTVISLLTHYATKAAKAQEEQRKLTEEQRKFKESITDLTDATNKNSEAELTKAKILYETAISEKKSRDERLKAANKLISLYPDLFKNMSAEVIMLGQAKSAYDSLTESIMKNARKRAAAEKYNENMSLVVDKETEIEKKENEIWQKVREREAIQKKLNKLKSEGAGYSDDVRYKLKENIDDINNELVTLNEELTTLYDNRRELLDANDSLVTRYDLTAVVTTTTETDGTIIPELPDLTPEPDKGKTSKDDRFAEEKAWRAKVEAEARIAYARGETTYTEHTNRMNDIDATYQSKLLSRTDLTEDERLKITADYWETVNKRTVAYTKELVDEENTSYEELTRNLKANHLQQLQATNLSAKERELAEKLYKETTELAELNHLARLVDIYDEGSDERLKAQQRYQDAELAAAKRHQQEREKLEAKYAKIKADTFGDNKQEKDTKFQEQVEALSVVYDRELAAAEGNSAEKLRIEKAYLESLAALRKMYYQDAEDENANSMQRAVKTSVDWLNSDGGKALTGSMSTLVSGMSSIFSGLSTMIQAELEIQTAQIENRYDKEIQLAQGNSYKVAKLEKQKEADIAKAKNEANKKMFAMQVIQAVAQTAQNALSAYGSAAAIPIVGHILAPIAAGMAIAAGMIQIASIKKQQQASEAQGYADGGFTKPGGKYEPAGIVHAGEWVASQELLASPVARPMIEALDYVQRTNTIGSLRPEDVSRSITATQSLSRMAESDNTSAMVIASISQNAQAVADLNNRLNEPFVTINTVAGDHGIKQAQDDYTRLINNVTPKKYKK